MTDPRSFGEWLRRERERRSITIRAIADRTKIGSGLLTALERGDVSRWPGGIYRRAFVRAYAHAIGLDADLVVANFERVFPEGNTPGAAAPLVPLPGEPLPRPHVEEMRLALVMPDVVAGVPLPAVKTACLDLACVLGFAVAGFVAVGPIGFWCAAAVAALVFHLARLFGGRTLLAGVNPLRVLARERRRTPRRDAAPGLEPRGEVVSFAGDGSGSLVSGL